MNVLSGEMQTDSNQGNVNMNAQRRVILALAGYNDSEERRHENNRNNVKEIYHETLLDGTNKHAIVIDELSGKKTFDYLLDNVDAIGNSHLVVVGDRKSLESIVAEHNPDSDVTVIQQGRSLPENLYKVYTEGKKIYRIEKDKASREGYGLSSQMILLLADHFMAKPESIIAASEAMREPYVRSFGLFGKRKETVIPDVSFGYCSMPEGDDERKFFSGRKFWPLKDGDSLRLSGIAAINVKENEYDLVSGKNLAILEQAYGARKALAFVNQAKLVGMAMRYAPELVGRYVSNNLSAEYFSKVLSRIIDTNFRLCKVGLDMEPDIDTEEDVIKARKMNWLKRYDSWTTARDCYEFLNRHGSGLGDRINIIGQEITEVSQAEALDILEMIKYGGRSPLYSDGTFNVNHAACIYYDLARSVHKDMKHAASELESFHRK